MTYLPCTLPILLTNFLPFTDVETVENDINKKAANAVVLRIVVPEDVSVGRYYVFWEKSKYGLPVRMRSSKF